LPKRRGSRERRKSRGRQPSHWLNTRKGGDGEERGREDGVQEAGGCGDSVAQGEHEGAEGDKGKGKERGGNGSEVRVREGGGVEEARTRGAGDFGDRWVLPDGSKGGMDGRGRRGVRLLPEEREEVLLKDGGWAGQGMPCLPQFEEKLLSWQSGGVGGGGQSIEEEEGRRERKREGKGGNSGFRGCRLCRSDVLWDILKELKGLCAEVGDLCAFAQCTMSVAENGWRTQRQISACINELRCHFMPEDDNEGSVRVGAENEGTGGVRTKGKEDGGDGAESEEMRDAEMEESGADMADNAMDETLH
jgi:hypothetical protein